MGAKNDTLDSLGDAADKLYAITQDPTASPEVWNAANVEFREVNHRLILLMGLQFDEAVAALASQAAKITQAKADLDSVLSNLKGAVDLVNGVTSFLKSVDDLIDTAKNYLT